MGYFFNQNFEQMKKHKTFLSFLFTLLLIPLLTKAQYTDNYLSKLKSYHEADLDVRQLEREVSTLGSVGIQLDNTAAFTEVELPMPNGDFARFRIHESSLMTPELAADRPYIKSYLGQGIDDPTAVVRFSITPSGLSAIIRSVDGITQIRAQEANLSNTEYISFYDHDIIADEPYQCTSQDLHDPSSAPGASLPNLNTNSCFALGDELREYEVALTCTGEFHDLNGGTVAGAEAALIFRLQQISLVYELELSVTFVASLLLVNTDAATDPFSNPTNTTTSLQESSDHIAANLGGANPDLGHGFHEITAGGWAGRAGVGVVCRTNASKFRGYTYLRNDIPSSTIVQLHEFGHMFSCQHSNYGCGSSGCGRYEPGQGTSIMSTSPGCTAADNYDVRTGYFGIGSLQSIVTYMTSGTVANSGAGCAPFTYSDWSNCPTITATTNNIPVSDANANGIDGLTIPNGTPFELNGTGTDADGNGSLTFNWEQYDTDLNSDIPANTGSNPTAALFRTFPPSTSDSRTVPQLSTILANSPAGTGGETLPTVARVLTWRLTVRDNEAGNGGIACDEITLNVAATGPFEITTQNSATAWSAGTTENISWDVAGTDAVAFTCPNVDILWSTDGGMTFPTTLASNVPNDGSQDITVPAGETSLGRLKIVCTGQTNIFFDINNVNIAIISGCPATSVDIVNDDPVTAAAGDPSLDLDLLPGLPITMVSGTLDNTDPTTNIAIISGGSCGNFSNDPVFEQRSFMVDVAGSYTISETASGYNNVITLYENSYAPFQGCIDWVTSSWEDSFVNPSITSSLVTNQVYVLINHGTNDGQFGTYNNTFSGPGTVFEISNVVPTGFEVYFVMVDDSGNIVDIATDADLSAAALYPQGTYTIHGLVSPGGTDFSAYPGTSFAGLQTDVSNGTTCGAFSGNTVLVTVQAALPVSLTTFSAKLIEPHVQLDWQTVSELNNDFFTLERSSDGRNFSELTKIAGNGTTTGTIDYEFLDKNPLRGTSYYRLLQTDFDGTSEFVGDIVVINRAEEKHIRIQPNPISADILAFQVSGFADIMEVYVYNTNGQLLSTSVQETTDGITSINLPVDKLSQGVYLLKVVIGERTFTERFIKSE